MALFSIVVHNHYYSNHSVNQNGNPVPPPDKKSEEGKSKSGFTVTILDIFIGASFATLQSIWNTQMLVWVISMLHLVGITFLSPWATSLLATFLIAIVICVVTLIARGLLIKLFS